MQENAWKLVTCKTNRAIRKRNRNSGMMNARQIEYIIGVQWGQKNPNPRAHRSSGKRGLPSFPLNGGPEGWDFSGTTEHQ